MLGLVRWYGLKYNMYSTYKWAGYKLVLLDLVEILLCETLGKLSSPVPALLAMVPEDQPRVLGDGRTS